LAYSLDIVGERWTLLIVRDLLLGPRRYTDLLNGLSGIGTNLLATRLKDLENAGILCQRRLPPPASASVYELTERGRGLETVIGALAHWGLGYLQMPPPEDDFLGVVPSLSALHLLFNPSSAAGVDLTCEIHAGQEIYHATIGGGNLMVEAGPAPDADVVIETAPKLLLQHLADNDSATNGDDFRIVEGSLDTFERFAAAFRFPQS
jgi:DNA-binding HxlR family transcriptional regulator